MVSSLFGNISFGGGTNYSGSKKLMNHQSALWKSDTQWLNENGWKQLRQGLINADYNPILAVGTSPSSAPTMNATANEPTISADTASAVQANTAKDIGTSQIALNKATAKKTNEEAITQQNIRSNLNADTSLKIAQKIWGDTKLPYDLKVAYTQALLNVATSNLNQTTAEWIPYNSESGRISANAAKRTSQANTTNARNGSWSRVIGSIGDNFSDVLGSLLGDDETKKLSKERLRYRNY